MTEGSASWLHEKLPLSLPFTLQLAKHPQLSKGASARHTGTLESSTHLCTSRRVNGTHREGRTAGTTEVVPTTPAASHSSTHGHRELGSGGGRAHNPGPSSFSSTCQPSPPPKEKAPATPVPPFSHSPCGGGGARPQRPPHVAEAPAIAVLPAATPVTAVTLAAAGHQRPWRHQQQQGHLQHLWQRPGRLESANSQIYPEAEQAVKPKSCALAPPTGKPKKDLELRTC